VNVDLGGNYFVEGGFELVMCLIDYRTAYRRAWRGRHVAGSTLRRKSLRRCPKVCPGFNLAMSSWERTVCRRLTANGMIHQHQVQYPVVLGNGKSITYTADIVVGDVIIEPHFFIDGAFINKMEAFRTQHPEKQVILVTLNDLIPNVPGSICNETVPIEYDELILSAVEKLDGHRKNTICHSR